MDAGSRVSFNCTADGVPTPSFTWLIDGEVVSTTVGKKYEVKNLTLAGGLRSNINETASSVLTVLGVLEGDAGLYVCTASNGRGQSDVIDMPFNLSVIPAPPPNYCDPNPCLNGATCESGAATFVCKCTDSYKGMTCNEGDHMYCCTKITLSVDDLYQICIYHTQYYLPLTLLHTPFGPHKASLIKYPNFSNP